MNKDIDYLLASKAFGSSGREHCPILIDGMAAAADARREFNRVLVAGLFFLLALVSIFVSIYVLRDKINYQFRQHGIKVQLLVPNEMEPMFADKSDGRSLEQ